MEIWGAFKYFSGGYKTTNDNNFIQYPLLQGIKLTSCNVTVTEMVQKFLHLPKYTMWWQSPSICH